MYLIYKGDSSEVAPLRAEFSLEDAPLAFIVKRALND